MRQIIDYHAMIGKRYGNLVVEAVSGTKSGGQTQLTCRCDCGVAWDSRYRPVFTGRTSRCRECAKKHNGRRSRTHGMRTFPEYSVWIDMRRRCTNPEHPKYPDYGGRGIRVCDQWLNDFARFYEDMGQRPGKGYSIERKDNDGHYCKDNCVWATMLEQNRNKRRKK